MDIDICNAHFQNLVLDFEVCIGQTNRTMNSVKPISGISLLLSCFIA